MRSGGKNYGTEYTGIKSAHGWTERNWRLTPAKPRYIITEVGVGYRLVDE